MKMNDLAAWISRHLPTLNLGALLIVVLMLTSLTCKVEELITTQKTASNTERPADTSLRLPTGYFQSLQSVLNDPVHWPNSANAIDKLFSELESLTTSLNQVQRMASVQDVEQIEWSLNALRFLSAVGNARLDREDWQELLDRAPKDARADLISAVKKAEPSSALEVADAVAEAEKALKTQGISTDKLSEAWQRLDGLSGNVSESEVGRVNQMKNQLKSTLRQLQTLERCQEVRGQLKLFVKLPDFSDQNSALVILLTSLTDSRLQLVKEGDPEPAELATLIADVRSALKWSAEQLQDTGRRDYQRWALEEVKKFEKIQNGGTSDAILAAFKQQLLPISEPNLERPVAILFNKAFDEGWKKLTDVGRDDLANAAATVKKTVPKTFN
jgi:uncharacterized protein YukE